MSDIKMKQIVLLWIITIFSLVLLPYAHADMSGWHTTDTGWSVNNENRLVGMTSGNPINIYSNTFDLRLNSTYTLKANITAPSTCTVSVDVNDGKCVSTTTWTETNACFTNQILTSSGEVTITTPATSPALASQGFFKNVSVRIHLDNCPGGAKFDDISFKEVSELNPSHVGQPPINATTACCPMEYCWDGSQCVMPTNWTNSTHPNLWDTLFLQGLLDQHVLISRQWLAKGYRCTLNGSGYADWTPAEIKYDWDFRESGYCMQETDCFVGNGYYDLANNGDQCIRHNQFMNDGHEINRGNHYCLNGEWTTKTYLIANVLENITKGKPYIMFCDDTGRIFNNAILYGAPETTVEGGCVVLSKDGPEERIITGIYVEEPSLTGEGNFMCTLYFSMANIIGVDPQTLECPHPDTIPGSYAACTPSSTNEEFLRCTRDLYISNSVKLTLYVNNESHYYLFSNNPIDEIDNTVLQQIWNSISNFFKRLFGYTPTEPLGLANQTTNYDRIYILSNNSLNVSAIEESKYDEELAELMVYMYLNMTNPGISQANNPFNEEFVNKSVGGAYYTFIEGPNSQVLTIKYSQPAKLWPYLTAMLRDRP